MLSNRQTQRDPIEQTWPPDSMRLIQTHIYTLTRMRICCRAWEQAIRDLSAAHEHRTDLLAIDDLRCGRPAAGRQGERNTRPLSLHPSAARSRSRS